MPKKAKQTLEQKRERDRLQKQRKYAEIKKDPEKYAEVKAKERARYLKRKENRKIKNVEDMTPRQLRNKRKAWRVNSKRHYENKKKEKAMQQLLKDNSPPDSDDIEVRSVEQDPLAPSASSSMPNTSQNCLNNTNPCQQCLKKDVLLRKLRYRHKKEIGILKQELEKKENQKNAIRKMLHRIMKNKKNNENISTEQKIEHLVENVNIERREEIKKKLMFGEILSRSVGEGYKCLRKKDKIEFSDVIMTEKEKFKKYKLLTKTKKFTVRNKKENKTGRNENLTEQLILDFFDDDSVTRIAADKKEYITKNKIRKQKRYLTDTLTNLYKKFTYNSNVKLSYQTFCKYRPFWVLYPKESNRNTCGCRVHINIDFLIKCLNINKIIKESNGTGILESLCCNINNENCLNRTCEKCMFRNIDYAEFQNDKKIKYYEWRNSSEKYFVKDKEKTKVVTKKETLYDFPRNIILRLENNLVGFMNHCNNIWTQYKNIKEFKSFLTPQEVVIHVDFSENYCVKYNEEIQSFHFGGSRMQLSLHTCAIYLIDPEVGIQKQYSFCTVSECTQHDAAAIWAHLIPTIGYVMEISTQIDTIHFISDSPTSQYRNRFIFYMISQLYRDFPQLKSVIWNYLEAGHGKGAPDGVGAVLKRTADQYVRFGSDVDSLDTFLTCLRSRVKIEIRVVTRSDIVAKSFPTTLKPAKGTMMVHQALWSYGCSKITLRKLSCFLCNNQAICCHGKHIGYYEIPCNEEVNTSQFQSFLDENTTPELIQEISETDFQIHSDHSVSSNRPHSPKVKILSDINVTDWVNRRFYINEEDRAKLNTCNNTFQTGFKEFIKCDSDNDAKENRIEIIFKKEMKEKRLFSFSSDSDSDDMNIF